MYVNETSHVGTELRPFDCCYPLIVSLKWLDKTDLCYQKQNKRKHTNSSAPDYFLLVYFLPLVCLTRFTFHDLDLQISFDLWPNMSPCEDVEQVLARCLFLWCSARTMSTAVILGGGVSGLAAVYYLQRQTTAKFAKVWSNPRHRTDCRYDNSRDKHYNCWVCNIINRI